MRQGVRKRNALSPVEERLSDEAKTEYTTAERGINMPELYFHGTILTMDDACPQVEALLVRDGKILKRGSYKSVAACRDKDTVCVDLQGKTMLPGFIDGHSHFAGVATSLGQCDLSQAQNFDDIVRLLQDFIQTHEIPEGQWVTGTNYDHNFLREKRHPDKFVLDAVSEQHPIVIVHASSHMGVVNSMGLRMQKLECGTPDPAGGHYGRLDGAGELSGYMEENAFVQFRNAMPMPDVDSILALFKQAQQIYASYGITTIQEGMVTQPLFQILRYAQEKQIFDLDLTGYLDLENCVEQLTKCRTYRNHFRIGGCKIFLDGSPQGRTAWMQAPYENAPDGYRGYPIKTDAQLYQLIVTALKQHQQLLAHCNGDAAAEQYITQFEKAAADYPAYGTNRPVMIHAQFVRKEQLERMANIQMMPSFFVAHTYYWGDIHIQNTGMERAKNISPAGTACRLNLPFTFHQDSPVLQPDVLQAVWCAAKRVTRTGVELSQEECISVYDGLKAVTIHAAYQYGEEADKGTISEGKRADLVILEKNPLTVPTDEVKSIRVLETIKDGDCVYRRM